MLKVSTFDDWIDYFYGWQKDIGLDAPEFREYKFEAKYGQLPHDEIEFGDYKGRLRWTTVMHIPDQRIRDAALNLIVYQGDTEFASVEQQRRLFDTAPSRYDYLSLVRVMTDHSEEPGESICRHGDGDGTARTVAVAFFCPEDREMWTIIGNPCEGIQMVGQPGE